MNRNIKFAEGVVVFLTLIGLQFIITWTSVRVKKVKEIVSGQPVLLLYKGEVFEKTMKKERITIEEIYAASSKHGIESLDKIEAIVLEPTGDIIVISKFESDGRTPETMKNVKGYPVSFQDSFEKKDPCG